MTEKATVLSLVRTATSWATPGLRRPFQEKVFLLGALWDLCSSCVSAEVLQYEYWEGVHKAYIHIYTLCVYLHIYICIWNFFQKTKKPVVKYELISSDFLLINTCVCLHKPHNFRPLHRCKHGRETDHVAVVIRTASCKYSFPQVAKYHLLGKSGKLCSRDIMTCCLFPSLHFPKEYWLWEADQGWSWLVDLIWDVLVQFFQIN